MEHLNNCLSLLYKILLVFEVSYQPQGKGMPQQSYNQKKIGKECLNILGKDWL